jgi:hypothetical protein
VQNQEKTLRTKAYGYLIQHPVQLIPSFNNTVTIIAINHKDEPLSVLEIMSPQRSNLCKLEKQFEKQFFLST